MSLRMETCFSDRKKSYGKNIIDIEMFYWKSFIEIETLSWNSVIEIKISYFPRYKVLERVIKVI